MNVFVKEERARRGKETKLVNMSMRSRARNFVKQFEKVLRKKNAEGSVHFHDWPYPQNDSTIITSENEGTYAHLRSPAFDADMAICVVPSIEKADGVIAELWLRERQLLHICLLTLFPLPEYEEDPDLYRGLLALPVATKRESGSVIYQTIHEKNEDGSIILPIAGSARLMTIDSFDAIGQRKLENIADLVQFQKEQ